MQSCYYPLFLHGLRRWCCARFAAPPEKCSRLHWEPSPSPLPSSTAPPDCISATSARLLSVLGLPATARVCGKRSSWSESICRTSQPGTRRRFTHGVPSLEHDGKVTGESLDLIKYIDSNFEGPALLPQDPAKRQFADELIAYAGAFTKALYSPLTSQVDMSDDTVAALDKIEAALSKFSDGPFFLGQFSLADIAYVTILERVQIYYSHLRNYEIAKGRPNLEKYIEEMNKIEAYTQTKNEPLNLLDMAKRHLKIA
ncbi:hypothetical protein BRADI_1g66020v3 [Brachypodium distachyon]|uniref:GST N-terminal domain-containing protein n=1 Tax=Brachypodium distachyon TaxID=15368 RepID=A0A0Q3HHM2_BRADI|nr:hypothetical protein BRADI_1g66020v3 [Brachypodium distachyon]